MQVEFNKYSLTFVTYDIQGKSLQESRPPNTSDGAHRAFHESLSPQANAPPSVSSWNYDLFAFSSLLCRPKLQCMSVPGLFWCAMSEGNDCENTQRGSQKRVLFVPS